VRNLKVYTTFYIKKSHLFVFNIFRRTLAVNELFKSITKVQAISTSLMIVT
jgi:hypothetical protein